MLAGLASLRLRLLTRRTPFTKALASQAHFSRVLSVSRRRSLIYNTAQAGQISTSIASNMSDVNGSASLEELESLRQQVESLQVMYLHAMHYSVLEDQSVLKSHL